jgi:hypothetical protein
VWTPSHEQWQICFHSFLGPCRLASVIGGGGNTFTLVDLFLKFHFRRALFFKGAIPARGYTNRLRPRTLKLRRNQIHAAVTALVESGLAPGSINCLGDLVSLDHFRRILRRRNEAVSGKASNFNRDLDEALVQIGKEWAKVDSATLAELKRLTAKVPMLPRGLVGIHEQPLWSGARGSPPSNVNLGTRAIGAISVVKSRGLTRKN